MPGVKERSSSRKTGGPPNKGILTPNPIQRISSFIKRLNLRVSSRSDDLRKTTKLYALFEKDKRLADQEGGMDKFPVLGPFPIGPGGKRALRGAAPCASTRQEEGRKKLRVKEG